MTELHSIELDVADGSISIRQRCAGRQLLALSQRRGLRSVLYSVYLTERGQYAAYITDTADTGSMARAGDDAWDDLHTSSEACSTINDKSLTFYPTREAMVADLPDDIEAAIQYCLDAPTDPALGT